MCSHARLLVSNLILGLTLAGPAAAQLLAVDLRTPGDELVTRDPSTGLDWLDLTETAGYSIDSLLNS